MPVAVELPPNPVWRSYVGGRVLREFRSLPGAGDDNFPEDWMASTVRARNGANSQHPDEGLSVISHDGHHRSFASLLETDPQYWFGPNHAGRKATGVLWKLLDSSVRLHFQAHPSAQFARQHLNSNAGKTECWYILGTRGEACVYLGFQHPPTREAWARMIHEQRVDEMLGCFERIPVKPGDCYVIPAGTPHAIGAGVFMMELMEPTDWVVRCETVTAGVALTPDQCFMGLGLEACLDIFDYRAYPVAEVRKTFQQTSQTNTPAVGFKDEELIAPAWQEFFRLQRLSGSENASWTGNELQLLIVLKGRGELNAGERSCALAAGQTWLLPGCGTQWRWAASSPWEVLLAKLPLRRLNRADAAT